MDPIVQRQLAQIWEAIQGMRHVRARNVDRLVGRGVLFKIISNATKGGTYNIRFAIVKATAFDPSASGNLDVPGLFEAPASNEGYAINPDETGASTHTLAADKFHFGVIFKISSDRKPIIWKTGGGAGIPDPTVIYTVWSAVTATTGGWDYLRVAP